MSRNRPPKGAKAAKAAKPSNVYDPHNPQPRTTEGRLLSVWSRLERECKPHTRDAVLKRIDLAVEQLSFGDAGQLTLARCHPPDMTEVAIRIDTDGAVLLTAKDWPAIRNFLDATFRHDIPFINGYALEQMSLIMGGIRVNLEEAAKKHREKADAASDEQRAAERAWQHDDEKSDGPLWEAAERDAREQERARLRELDKLSREQMADAVETGTEIEIDPATLPPKPQVTQEPAQAAPDETVAGGPLAGVNAAVAKSLADAGVVKAKRTRKPAGQGNAAAQVEELAQTNGKAAHSNGKANGKAVTVVSQTNVTAQELPLLAPVVERNHLVDATPTEVRKTEAQLDAEAAARNRLLPSPDGPEPGESQDAWVERRHQARIARMNGESTEQKVAGDLAELEVL